MLVGDSEGYDLQRERSQVNMKTNLLHFLMVTLILLAPAPNYLSFLSFRQPQVLIQVLSRLPQEREIPVAAAAAQTW